jgi:hypothetical protein
MGESAIPVAYGVPIAATALDDIVPTAPTDLRTATTINGGRSSRVLLPARSQHIEPLPESVFQTLAEQGFTRGLAEALLKNKIAFPLKIWIVDNSGSMNHHDGHRFIATKRKDDIRLVECSRWAEMQQTVDYHAQMAALLQSPTVFRLLNDPGRLCGPQQFSIAETEDLSHDLAVAQSTILNTSPSGVTPLTEHLQEIRQNIQDMLPQLRQDGSKVVVVIATDGTPTDSQGLQSATTEREFVAALKGLEGLPVWVVVRLCTDDETVVQYWNNLDGQLELSLEVLDDFVSEAEEVYEHNKWLNYGLPLHRMREMGFHHRLFDLLDERPLSKDELRDFCRIMLGDGKMDGVPDPQAHWDDFVSAISAIVQKESKQWNPISKRVEPWIDIKRLKRDYGKGLLRYLW